MASYQSTQRLRDMFGSQDDEKKKDIKVSKVDYSRADNSANALRDSFSQWTPPSIQAQKVEAGNARIRETIDPLAKYNLETKPTETKKDTTGGIKLLPRTGDAQTEPKGLFGNIWNGVQKAVQMYFGRSEVDQDGNIRYVTGPEVMSEQLGKTKFIQEVGQAQVTLEEAKARGEYTPTFKDELGINILRAAAFPVDPKPAMNTETGKAIISTIGNKTSNLPLKGVASMRAIGDETYNEAYTALLKDRNNPDNGAIKQFLYELQDSGVQSLVGVLLTTSTAAITRSPKAAYTVGSAYYGALSAGEQLQKKGEVYSTTDIVIDTVGDQVLNAALLGIFKQPASVLGRVAVDSAIEGTTEVTQTLLKFSNDYARAKTQEERDAILADAREYITSGAILMEFSVGATVGAIAAGGAEVLNTAGGKGETQQKTTGADEVLNTAGSKTKKATKEKGPSIQNATDIIAKNARGEELSTNEQASLGTAQEIFNDYSRTFEQKTTYIPAAISKTGDVSVEVNTLPIGDKFVTRFAASAGEAAVVTGYDLNTTYNSANAANEAAINSIVQWAESQRLNEGLSQETRTRLEDAIRLAKNPKEVLPVKKSTKRITEGTVAPQDGTAEGIASSDNVPTEGYSTFTNERAAMQNVNGSMYRSALRAKNVEDFIKIMSKGKPETVDHDVLREWYNRVQRVENGVKTETASKEEGTKKPASKPKKKTKKPLVKSNVQENVVTITPEDLKTVKVVKGRVSGPGNTEVRKLDIAGKTYDVPKQQVTKTDLRNILAGEKRIDFKVSEKGGTKYLTYESENTNIAIRPSAMGLVEDTLNVGTTVRLDADVLKQKGTSVRAVDKEGEVLAEFAWWGTKRPTLTEAQVSKLTPAQKSKYKYIYPQLKKLRMPKEGEVIIYFNGDGDVDQYVDTDINRHLSYHAEKTSNVLIVKRSDLKSTGFKNKNAVGERLLKKHIKDMWHVGTPHDIMPPIRYVGFDDEVLAEVPPKPKHRTRTGEVIASEYNDIAGRVRRAEPEGKKPSRFISRQPSVLSELGDTSINENVMDAPASTDVAAYEQEKLVRRAEIGRQLAKKLNATVRYGKYRQRALGIYKPNQNVVRLGTGPKAQNPRVGGQLTTLFHEIGHFIDYTVHNFNRNVPDNEVNPLLKEYGGGSLLSEEITSKMRKEAFAEFLRYYTTQPDVAKKTAPKFYEYYEKEIAKYPEVQEAIETARDDFKRWADQPATAKVMSQINFEQKDDRGIKVKLNNKLHQIYRDAVDDLHPLSQFVGLSEQQLKEENNPYVLARNMRGWIGRAQTFLERGTIKRNYWKDGKVEYTGKSLKDILEPIDKRGALNEFSTYLVARRAIELNNRDIVTGITTADAKVVISEMETKHEDFSDTAKEIKKYQDALLDYLYECGLIDQKALRDMRAANEEYVPYFRVQEELTQQGYMGGKGIATTKKQIKRIKGSDKEIIDPIESIVKNTYALINAAERNNVMSSIADLVNNDKKLAPMFERVPGDMAKVAQVNAQSIVYQALGINPESPIKSKQQAQIEEIVDTIVPDSLVNIFRPSMFQKGNVVTVMKKGKPTYYEVDPDLYGALNSLETEEVGLVAHLFSIPAQFLRAGATLTPEFMLRNPLRDTWTAAIYSRHGFTPVWDTMRGLFSLIKKDQYYQSWLISGGELASLVSQDRETLKQTKDELLRRNERIKKYIKSPLEVLRLVSSYSEQATRIGEARLALVKGKSPQAAAYAAREVSLDFLRSGAKLRILNKLSAFFNATIQGNDKMVRTFKEFPARTALKTMLFITLPSVMLYFLNRDEEGWDEIPQWQKDLFWLVKVGETWYRIPKPFELGLLFGSFPERVLEYIDKRDPDGMKEIAHTIIQGTFPNPLPTGVTPILENITNYSFFLDRPIVTQGMSNLPPSEQYTRSTSETSKIVGQYLNYSPAKMDNLIRGYFAGLGAYALETSDAVLKGTGVVANVPEPEKTLSDMPGVKAFVVREPIGSAGKSVDDFYAARDQATKSYNRFKDLAEAGKKEQAEQYIQDHPEVKLYKEYNKVAKTISEIRKARDAVYDSNILTPEQKRAKLRELDQLMTTVSYRAINIELQ